MNTKLTLSLLVYGGNGWIGKQICQFIKDNTNIKIIYGTCRVDNDIDLENEIIKVKPDRILSLIGRVSGPGCNTIDYLEDNSKLVENLTDNLYAPLILTIIAKKYSIHLTQIGTGCIFDGYKVETNGYLESDIPDYFSSNYSIVKGFTDRIMHQFENDVLNIRIRMPVTTDDNPKNLIIKLMKYKKICSVPNSISVLPDIIPIIIDLIIKEYKGTINLTNPGLITHNEILSMMKEIINPELEWTNINKQELRTMLLADRSNNLLNTDKLISMYPDILPIKESIKNILFEIKSKYFN